MSYRQLTVSEVCDRLQTYGSVRLLMHSSPDGDTFGSCMALYHVLTDMSKKAYIVYPDSKFPSHLVPFASCEVFSGDEAEGIECDATVSVDVASPSQLRDNYDRYKDSISLMIDHHRNGTPMADHLIRPDAAAVGEIVMDICDELVRRGSIRAISREAAEAIYLSISSDTGCFKYSNTTAHTHRCAARLIEMGVDAAAINQGYFDSKSPLQIEAEKITYNNIRILLGGRFAVCALDKETKRGIENENFENAVNIVRSVKGSIVGCTIKEKDDTPGSFRVSLRTTANTGVDVSEICAHFGGGGHVCAAGCAVDAENIEAALSLITQKVKEAIGNG